MRDIEIALSNYAMRHPMAPRINRERRIKDRCTDSESVERGNATTRFGVSRGDAHWCVSSDALSSSNGW